MNRLLCSAKLKYTVGDNLIGRYVAGIGEMRTQVMLLRVYLGCCLLAACVGRPGPRDLPTLRADLAARLQAAQTAQTAIADLWADLLNREEISCARRVSAPPPFDVVEEEAAAFPEVLSIVEALNAGIEQVAASAAVWDEECRSRDEIVTDEVIAAGVQAAESAVPLLDEAQAGLNRGR